MTTRTVLLVLVLMLQLVTTGPGRTGFHFNPSADLDTSRVSWLGPQDMPEPIGTVAVLGGLR